MRRTKTAASASAQNGFDGKGRLSAAILPRGVDGRSRAGQRIRAYAHHLAQQVEHSADPITRARILSVATLIVESEKMTWDCAEGKAIDARRLATLSYAVDLGLRRLGFDPRHVLDGKLVGDD